MVQFEVQKRTDLAGMTWAPEAPGSRSHELWALGDVLAKFTTATGAVEFNWPKIEEQGHNPTSPVHGLCRILLAARQEPPP